MKFYVIVIIGAAENSAVAGRAEGAHWALNASRWVKGHQQITYNYTEFLRDS